MATNISEPLTGEPLQRELLDLAERAQFPNYRPAPFVLSEGSGCRVKDVSGRSYLDLAGGIAVLAVGHCHPRLSAAIAKQASQLMHVSNLFYNDRAIELAGELTRRTVFDRVFFCNSGAEANEALLKLARRYHYEQGDKERVKLISTIGSFHGRSMGALSLTGQAKYHKGMEPLVPEVVHVPYGDIAAMREAIDDRTAGVLLEPIQAEGGLIVGDDEFFRELRALCTERGALLLFDEVQTGYGRTGRFLAREHSGVVPDACALAKGIGGGFPLGAMLTTERMAKALPPGAHATTFGGNALACAAGLAVLQIMDDENLIVNATTMGVHLEEHLTSMVDDFEAAEEARGRGLLRGIKLADGIDPRGVLIALRDHGVLATLAGGVVLRISPPLTVTRDELDEGVEAIRRVLKDPPRLAS